MIEKTLMNRRGYKYRKYKTEIKGDKFILHYEGTPILKCRLDKKEIIDYVIMNKDNGHKILHTLQALSTNSYPRFPYVIIDKVIYRIITTAIKPDEYEFLIEAKKFHKMSDKERKKLSKNLLPIVRELDEKCIGRELLYTKTGIKLVEGIVNGEDVSTQLSTLERVDKRKKKRREIERGLIEGRCFETNNAILMHDDKYQGYFIFYKDSKKFRWTKAVIHSKNFTEIREGKNALDVDVDTVVEASPKSASELAKILMKKEGYEDIVNEIVMLLI